MFPRPQASTSDTSLESFCEKLQSNPGVVAIVLAGSTATGPHPSSDLDIGIVVETDPCPARTGVSWVDGRLADLGFASRREVEGFSPPSSTRPDEWPAIMRAGKVIYDRDGIFQTSGDDAEPYETPTAVLFNRWDHTSYNLAQSERYVEADDPLYHEALRLRMTYQMADVMLDYFALRHLPWRGEKEAIRYSESHDPEFKKEFLHCLEETDLAAKFASYKTLVRLALAPIGEPWSRPAVSITPTEGFDEHEAMQFWRQLAGGE